MTLIVHLPAKAWRQPKGWPSPTWRIKQWSQDPNDRGPPPPGGEWPNDESSGSPLYGERHERQGGDKLYRPALAPDARYLQRLCCAKDETERGHAGISIGLDWPDEIRADTPRRPDRLRWTAGVGAHGVTCGIESE